MTVVASSMYRNLKLENEISRELEDVFTNGLLFVGSFISDQLAFWVDFPFKDLLNFILNAEMVNLIYIILEFVLAYV